jgi:hypothetical protein
MQHKGTYKLHSKVFRYPGMSGWHFIGIPKKQSEEIKKHFGTHAKGWGSLPVHVTLGKTKWKTSIFPDKNLVRIFYRLRQWYAKKNQLSMAT